MESWAALPSVAEIYQSPAYDLAKANWLVSDKKVKFKESVIADLIGLVKDSTDAERELSILSYLFTLEKFLWPNWSDKSSDDHAILIAMVSATKKREGSLDWELFSSKSDKDFPALIERILALSSTAGLPLLIKNYLISFMDAAFASLEIPFVRQQFAPLVSISIWNSLSSVSFRDSIFATTPSLKKSWRSAAKRFDAADDHKKTRMRLERGWLFTVCLELLTQVHSKDAEKDMQLVKYSERVLELLIDILSQLPTRKFTNTMLKDMNFAVVFKLSPLYATEKNWLARQLLERLEYYIHFPVDDFTGAEVSDEQIKASRSKDVLKLQKIALDHFKDKLLVLALSNYGSVSTRSSLLESLDALDDTELKQLCEYVGIATAYPPAANIPANRQLYLELLLDRFVRRPQLQELNDSLELLPTEKSLSNPILKQAGAYTGRSPLPIPRFNLQFLTLSDFLRRTFELSRLESFYEIKTDIEAIMNRLKLSPGGGMLKVNGTSRMAHRISRPSILTVADPLVGETQPAFVRAELYLEFDRATDEVLKEWDMLKPGDVVFLACVAAPPNAAVKSVDDLTKIGVKCVRSAEVVDILDQNNQSMRSALAGGANDEGKTGKPANGRYSRQDRKPLFGKLARRRRIHVNLDAASYATDDDKVYASINYVFRRRPRENNFKPVLENVKTLATSSELSLPEWLVDVFMGFGDPMAASYETLVGKDKSVNMNDTFVDWAHLKESFDEPVVLAEGMGSFEGALPPYEIKRTTRTVEQQSNPEPPAKKSKGRKSKKTEESDLAETTTTDESVVEVSTYRLPNMGPYAVDTRKRNTIPYTRAQVRAIYSGTLPGLTLIVGPPGTGKTDVATQIISNIYHNNQDERILVVAHSNQALNHLFEKIAAFDIDERHLLRLGRGEEDLKMDESYSRLGRVESLLARRSVLLAEVKKLADSVGAQGSPEESCEKAGYFYTVFVSAVWEKFKAKEYEDVKSLAESFPFSAYFADAPQPLFNIHTHSLEEAVEIADGCFRHLQKIFNEIEDVRPFELLKSGKARANYLLAKKARIVALTATHAAMQRNEMVALGFHYENVVVEEAAQLTELESFIPLTLQSSSDRLKRIVLVGDHHQNAPIIKNTAFKSYANMEQSLFSRLLRLGVPRISLDAQGRARPSLAELYAWRYEGGLRNLPRCVEDEAYKTANAGFLREFQFINVEDYHGQGESEPSPNFHQNLGEAEYSVAIYMYMRLLGYSGSQISILTPYAGQKVLIENVLAERCEKNPIFGPPAAVATVDQYQGEQNDYVILSLVRTKSVGYLRDVRRMTVALSRARLGLYVLGRREVLESSFEVKQFLDKLDVNRTESDRLVLALGEMYPSLRALGEIEEGKQAVMEGVEHLGQFVYEMTKRKMEKMKEEGLLAAAAEEKAEKAVDVSDEEMADDDDDDDDDEDEDEEEEEDKDDDAMEVEE